MDYDRRTLNSPNPIVRFAHRSRLAKSLHLVPRREGWLIDYGCGDGSFCQAIADRDSSHAGTIGFEPHMPARAGVSVRIFSHWSDVLRHREQAGPAAIVTCFETLEHFTEEMQWEAIERFAQVLSAQGRLIISVPVEGGMPSLLKNSMRRMRYGVNGVYSLENIIKSALWRPIPSQRQNSDYLSHMGFYYHDLCKVVSERFDILETHTSPFGVLPGWLNSQVFLVASKRD